LPNIEAAAEVVMRERQVDDLPHASIAVDETVAKQPAVMDGEEAGSQQVRPAPNVIASRVSKLLH
jgi:hypothetical protein